jgi:hypothetical protein
MIMSSTWFKSLSALKLDIVYRDGGYPYTNYLLIAETAESNVTNDNGGHDYHKWIYAEGEYDEIMRKVCQGAVDFDNGMAKWKPNHKDSVGFIRMVKKALENAKEATKIPYYLTGTIFWDTESIYKEFIPHLEDVANIEKKKMYGYDALVTEDIKTYIVTKRKINRIIQHYQNSLINPEMFKKWFDNNKDFYF